MTYIELEAGKTFDQYLADGTLGQLDPKDIALLVKQDREAKQAKATPGDVVLSDGGVILTAKVGEKGGISVYGLGRFPVTLYFEQWLKLFMATDGIVKFGEKALADGRIAADTPEKRKARRDAEKAAAKANTSAS